MLKIFIFLALLEHILALPLKNVLKPDNYVSISQQNAVYIHESYINVSQILPLSHLEKSIDLTKFRLASLKYAEDITFFEPRYIFGTNKKEVTLFQRPVPANLIVSLCKQLQLPVLDLQNIPPKFETEESILINLDITMSFDSLLCSSDKIFYKDDDCLSYLLTYTKSREFFRKKTELRTFLFTKYPDRSIVIWANNTDFYFSPILHGTAGCFGAPAARKVDDIQRVHDIYFKQLFSTQMSILDLFDSTLNHLSEAVHSLTTQNINVPIEEPFKNLIPQILSILPTYLPNHGAHQVHFPTFEQFFIQKVVLSQDKMISDLNNQTFLSKLPEENLRLILKALKQFEFEIRERLDAFLSEINPTVKIEAPKSVLLKPTQNPTTFVFFVHSLSAKLNEEILTEAFIILQNTKTMLVQEIASILKIPVSIRFLSLSDYNSITDNGLYYSKSKEMSPGSIRLKRSWGTFWGSVWGTASQEEVNELYKNEVDMSKSELKLQAEVLNISTSNSKLLSSFKTVTNSVDTLERRQQTLFKDLQEVIQSDEQFLQSLYNLSKVQDHLTFLTSEYMAIHGSTVLIMHSLMKTHMLIEIALSKQLDISQMSSLNLKALLPGGFKKSITEVETFFKFDPAGYKIVYKIPKFSGPYFIYNIKQIPVFKDNKWYSISNLQEKLVMSPTYETLSLREVSAYCTPSSKDYVCPENFLSVKRPTEKTCTTQLISGSSGRLPEDHDCRYSGIYYTTGLQYIVKTDLLYISNPAEKDYLLEDCYNNKTKTILSRGNHVFQLKNDCTYETSEFTSIKVKKSMSLESDYNVDFETDLINRLVATKFTEDQSSEKINMKGLHELITKFKDDILPEGKALTVLESEITKLNSIEGFTQIDPLRINIRNPTQTTAWLGIVFWFCIIISGFVILFCIQMCIPNCFCLFFEKIIQGLKYIFNRIFCKKWHTSRTSFRAHYFLDENKESNIELQSKQLTSRPLTYAKPVTRHSSLENIRESAYFNLDPLECNEEEWTFKEGPYGNLLLASKLLVGNDYISVHYDLKDNNIKDDYDNYFPKMTKPKVEQMNKYMTLIETWPLPDLMKNDFGEICLKAYPSIKLTSDGTWINKATNKQISGLRSPTRLEKRKAISSLTTMVSIPESSL